MLAAVIGVWIGLAAAAAGAGWLKIARPVPVVGLFVVVPLLAAAQGDAEHADGCDGRAQYRARMT